VVNDWLEIILLAVLIYLISFQAKEALTFVLPAASLLA
jgi:hypothetical protein